MVQQAPDDLLEVILLAQVPTYVAGIDGWEDSGQAVIVLQGIKNIKQSQTWTLVRSLSSLYLEVDIGSTVGQEQFDHLSVALFGGEDQRTETLEISDVDLEISVLQKESHDLSVAPDSCTGQRGIAVQLGLPWDRDLAI